MRPSFSPQLVSESPFGDPALFVPLTLERRALLFDAGATGPLSARDILKISHIFISHAHMDHFMGFDRILMLCLGREKALTLFGPAGFMKNVEGKLSAYVWNLARRFENDFSITAAEVSESGVKRRSFHLKNAFVPGPVGDEECPAGLILSEPSFSVRTALLDHGTPCLGFALRERFHVNVLAGGLAKLGLSPGPWLSDFKKALYDGADPSASITVSDGSAGNREFSLGFLSENIAMLSPGQSFGYVTDVVASAENERKITALVEGVDHLYIEAAFLDQDAGSAAEKFHLTAGQAGRIARKAGVKRLTVFHFSPRYSDDPGRLINEALEEFKGGCVI